MRIKTLNKKIKELENKYKNVKGTQTGVFCRITGYYRNVDPNDPKNNNWNKGKTEEYRNRKMFDLKKTENKYNQII